MKLSVDLQANDIVRFYFVTSNQVVIGLITARYKDEAGMIYYDILIDGSVYKRYLYKVTLLSRVKEEAQ